MSAITGLYRAPNKGIGQWTVDWLHTGPDRWTSPREHLAEQMRYIKRAHNRHEAREFRNYLLWLGVYPSRRRSYR